MMARRGRGPLAAKAALLRVMQQHLRPVRVQPT